MSEIELRRIKVDDPFWSARQNLVIDTVIPYQEQILNDRIPGIEKSHAIDNFRIAAGMIEGEFYGMVFQDSDLAKWMEGASYSLIIRPDAGLEERLDEIIDILEKAQQEDGYLDTYFIVKEPEHRFQNLQECHELYCAGHMMEAAVAYYEATGKDKFLKIMCRAADCIDANIGAEEGKIRGIPGHEEVEIGLMRLYRATGNDRYLRLAKYFIDERGRNPEFFHEESRKRGWFHWGNMDQSAEYMQAHMRVRDQSVAVGHSVRACYLYTAMADLANETGDRELLDACRRLFRNITEKQMYITAGIGQTARWEGFTHDYDLPNDTAYAETCASIALVFFARRLLDAGLSGEYADVMERAVYNGILSGMQLDGRRFFYVNPLEVNPGVSGKLPGFEHVLPVRPQWYACACCPPNVVRLLTSLGRYAWDERDGMILAHLFLGGKAELSLAAVSAESRYPFEGFIRYRIDPASEGSRFTFAVHIPGHVKSFALKINGAEEKAVVRNGYLYLDRSWNKGDTAEISFDLPVRRVYADPRVRADEGMTAIMRGPFVYAFEGADNGENIQELRIPRTAEFSVRRETEGILAGLDTITFTGERMVRDEAAAGENELYSESAPRAVPAQIKAIPYFAWANRGENQMRVWMPES